MRHGRDHRQFGRNTSHRRAMFRNMANAVILQEQIVTTVQKAKEARRVVDRLITLGKGGDAGQRRLAFDRTRDKQVVEKLFDELAKRYQGRSGGYTRVLKMSDRRRGDAAEMAVLELVDHPELKRKRSQKAATPAGEAAEGTTDATASADPFSRFRKLFGGTRKGKAELKEAARKAAGAEAPAEKKASKKKAPAAEGEAKEAKAKSSEEKSASAGKKKKKATKKTAKKTKKS